ncbi:hypothetical protein Hanom_Chr05g00392641 [Helianthus anomalus]
MFLPKPPPSTTATAITSSVPAATMTAMRASTSTPTHVSHMCCASHYNRCACRIMTTGIATTVLSMVATTTAIDTATAHR